jgi:hypothetical protein
MASTRRKSAAIALAVVGIAGLSLASAAQLNVNASSLGAGTDVVASCDTDGIDVDFTNVLDGIEYNSTELVLSDVNAACNGLAFQVQLLTGDVGSETPLGSEITGNLTVALNEATIAIDQPA